MQCRKSQLLIILAFAAFMLIPTISNENDYTTVDTLYQSYTDNFLQIHEGGFEIAGAQDEASWWNSTYIYRRYFNFTEPGITDRSQTPVHLYLTFITGHCYKDSIRVGYYNESATPKWTMLPFKTWNTTYFSGGQYIESTRVSFMANVSKNQNEPNYYIYYAKIDVGSVSYPDFYPFIYKSYTFSLINLVSYYDDNNYLIEMWDSSSEEWDDPRIVDSIWFAGQVTPNNVPNGTLDKMENVRYEPTSYSYTAFRGYYAIYSNYPLGVSMGQGNEGQNAAINDWFPGVSELGSGISTNWIFGGVEGFEDRNEGKYWIQATENNTEVWAWTSDDSPDTGWKFHNISDVSSWPAILDAGEYISKRDVIYSTYMKVNSTKPVHLRQGDSDCTYARDIWAFYPSITGALAGEEFYTIDMGNSNDYTRVTNLGSTSVQVDWWRNSGSGWGSKNTITVAVNSSQLIARGTAGSSDQEDILHIKGPTDSMLMVEGVYNPTTSTDAGDWVPTVTGHRFGTRHKLWGINSYKFIIVATENAHVEITGYNDGTLDIPADGMAEFRPLSSGVTLYHIVSNASIGVLDLGKFSTSSPYNPTGDTGYGWMVPTYHSDEDSDGFTIEASDERHLFEFDITVLDLDGIPVEGASVVLYNTTTDTIWQDENENDRTGSTDANGLIIFEGLNNGTYNISVKIDAKNWLTTNHANVWVVNQSDHPITGSVTPIQIILPMGSFSIHYNDLMGDSMDQTADETTNVRITDIIDHTADGSDYIDQTATNETGWAIFLRIPKNNYKFFVKYSGNVSSYDYDEMLEFANWSISTDEFGSQPFQHFWALPLVTLRINVKSWDDQLVVGATIKINNSMNQDLYSLTESSNINGNYTFYRIVNGTWNINVWKVDDYPETKTARNNTVSVDVQNAYQKMIHLPLTRLNIRVRTDPFTFVSGAQVNVTLRGGSLVAQGTTNGTGQITFQNIHGNMSSQFSVSYNITVIAGDNPPITAGFVIEILAKCDSDWWYVNNITISTPQYLDTYTELNSTQYIVNVRWGRNASFVIGYFDRDDSGTSAVSPLTTTWVNFTIYSGSTKIGTGTWNNTAYDWVKKAATNNVNFTVTIDTDYWLLNMSETAYSIKINAHTNGYDNPATITIYLTVLAAQTVGGYDVASISEYYKTHQQHVYYLKDTTNGENVTNLNTYTYGVKFGAILVRSGSLQESGEVYILPSSALHGLEIGSYLLTIDFKKRNYNNQTITIDVTINQVPMEVSITSANDYIWSLNSESITFEYLFDGSQYVNSSIPNNGQGLTSITVNIEWLTDVGVSYLNITRVLSPSGGVYTYGFNRNLLPVGDWNITITCSKTNYRSAIGTLSTLITVSKAPTDLVVSNGYSDTTIVEWQTDAIFEINFTRSSDDEGLVGASFSHNWTTSISIDRVADGRYLVEIGTDISASTYILNITLSLDNHEDSWIQLTVSILIPLLIESEYASAETPIEAYWTQTFNLEILLRDLSRSGQTVDGATVTYDWYLEFVVDKDGTLGCFAGGIYNTTLNAFDAIPNSPPETPSLYTIIITANKTGSTEVQTTIFLKINPVPNEIVLESSYFEAFYADIFDVRFYWNNTLDNQPITSPDETTYSIINPPRDIGGGVNYGDGNYSFTIDTRNLQMTPAIGGSVYVIRIEMEKEGFQVHTLTTVIILVRETPASLIIDPIDNVNWSDSFLITATLYDTYHDVLIDVSGEIEAATITVSYGPYSYGMTNNLDGTFSRTIDSEDWFSASATPYTLTFTYALPYFVDSTNTTAVTIDPIEAEVRKVSPISSSITVTWGDEFTVIVLLVNTYAEPEQTFTAGSVYYQWGALPVQGDLALSAPNFQTTINASEVPAGGYILYIRGINENYTITQLGIPVTVNTVATSFESDQSQYSVEYGETGLEIVLTYRVSGGSSLPGATVTMNYAGSPRTATFDPATGTYKLSFNPSTISSTYVPGILTLNITASLQNYTTKTIHPELELVMRTELSGPAAVSWYYADVRQVTLQWDALNAAGGVYPTDSAQVRLWNATHALSGNISGLVHLGDGSYRISVYTALLGMDAIFDDNATRYFLKITLTKERYVTGQLSIIIDISQTSTEMTADDLPAITWSDDFILVVHLNDSRHDVRIYKDAIVTFSYGSYSNQMTSSNNGTFYLEENSANVFSAGTHTVTISYTIPNYVDGSLKLDITIDPLFAEIFHFAGSTTSYSGTWRDEFDIEVGIREVSTETRLPQTNVIYYWVEFDVVGGTLTYDSDSDSYWIEIDTEEVPAGTWTLRITATLVNYSIQYIDIPVTLNPFEAILVSDEEVLYAVFSVTQSLSVHLLYATTLENLNGALVTFRWNGQTRSYSTYDNTENRYVFDFNPSADESLPVPGYIQLNFTASLQNYTTDETTVLLRLSAATEISGPDKSVEAESRVLIEFRYWDVVNDAPIPGATIQYQIGEKTPTSEGLVFNGSWYIVDLAAEEIGPVRDIAYEIRILASARGYQNWTAADPEQIIQVDVTPVMILIPIPLIGDLIGPIQRDYLYQFLMLTGLFIALVGTTIGVRRWRIPFQIKQIDKAIKAIDKGKTASIEGIKSMGSVISELLAPGLADLDIALPSIDVGLEPELPVDLGEEAGELLGELDALDELGIEEPSVEEPTDFEAELAAELEEIVEEEAAPEITEPEVLEEELYETEEIPEEIEEVLEPEAVLEEEVEEQDESKLEPEEPEPDDEFEEISEEPEFEAEPEQPTRDKLIAGLPDYVRDSFSDEDLEHLTDDEIKELSSLTEEEFRVFRESQISDDEYEE